MSEPTPAPASHPNARADLPCPDCNTPMTFRPEGKFGPWYGCPRYPDCTGAHGAHPNGAPLGIPVTKATREARIRVHAAFDALWRGCPRYDSLPKPRELAYRWLADRMRLDPADCHIGQFTADQCERAEVVLASVRVGVWRAHLTEWSELPGEPPAVRAV